MDSCILAAPPPTRRVFPVPWLPHSPILIPNIGVNLRSLERVSSTDLPRLTSTSSFIVTPSSDTTYVATPLSTLLVSLSSRVSLLPHPPALSPSLAVPASGLGLLTLPGTASVSPYVIVLLVVIVLLILFAIVWVLGCTHFTRPRPPSCHIHCRTPSKLTDCVHTRPIRILVSSIRSLVSLCTVSSPSRSSLIYTNLVHVYRVRRTGSLTTTVV